MRIMSLLFLSHRLILLPEHAEKFELDQVQHECKYEQYNAHRSSEAHTVLLQTLAIEIANNR